MAKSSSSEGKCNKYKGVRKRKWGKWVSEIRLPKCRERIWLGSYDSPEKAARAFDAAMFCLRGRNATFNFPHNPPPNIPAATSLTPSQIQLAAARFANSYEEKDSENNHNHHPDLFAATATPNTNTNTNNNITSSDYGIFPGFDDFYTPQMPFPDPTHDDDSRVDHHQHHLDDLHHSFLWNF